MQEQISQEKTPRQKTISFYQTVEAGDIALLKVLDEAVFLLGFTKVGKTSTAHCVCDSPLKVELQNSHIVYKPSSYSKFAGRVGNITDSETEIPNIFKTSIKNPQTNKKIDVVVVDLPGYGDTYGFHRIFSNGYFHYRSFSKTAKIKFVITFTFNSMESDGSRFKSTIQNFINTFKNYTEIKDKILEATSFLITKVDKGNSNQQALRNTLRNKLNLMKNSVKGMGTNKKNNYQQIITRMLDKNRIYWICKPTQVGTSISQNKILQDIYCNSEFWERQKSENNPCYISMKNVNFSVANQIIHKLKDKQEELFHEDFAGFMQYTQEKLNQMMTEHEGSLDKMVRQLMKDAIGKNDSNNFLSCMERFNTEYYSFNAQCIEERKQIKSDLFKNEDIESFSASTNMVESDFSRKEKDKKNYYFIKKFEVLSYLAKIQVQKTRQVTWNNTDRTIEQLQQTSTMFKKIFQKFSCLSTSKAQLQTIYSYSYIIQRLIQEFKIITLILFTEKEHIEYFNHENILSQDLSRAVTDKFLTYTLGEIQIKELKLTFIKNVNFDDFVTINEDIIDFFEDLTGKSILGSDCKPQLQKNYSHKKQFQITNKQIINISLRVVGLLKKFHTQILKKQNEKELSKYESLYLTKKLFQYRKKLYDQIKNIEDFTTKKMIISNVISMSKMLAQYFLGNKDYKKAKKCYISINDPYSLFEVYQKQINEIKNPQNLIDHQLEYGDIAKKYGRKDVALKCYQKAYSLSDDCDLTNKISSRIVSLQELDNSKEESQYMYNLRFGKFCLDLSQQVHKLN